MKKIITLTAMLIAGLISIKASATDTDWMSDDCLRTYSPKTNQLVKSPTATCNKGAEPFSQFIEKFRTSAKFRAERKRFEAESPDEMMFSYLGDWECGYRFPVYKYRKRCDKSWAGWVKAEENTVYYSLMDDLPCDDGGSSMSVRFQRIDGKWYITGFTMAG